MEQDGTSNEKTSDPPAQSTLHEVRTAENSAGFLLPKLQSMKETNSNLKMLDVGCGSGTISVSFAKLIPQGHVTGIDLNGSIIPRAEALARQAGVTNVTFQQGSIYKLPFDDATFDITYCHQVLVHIGNPWEAVSEMLRVTKSGGIVAAREGDYETECIWPELEGLKKFHGLMAGLMRSGGGSSSAGRQLVSWALRAGADARKVTLSYSPTSYTTIDGRKTCSQGLCQQLRGGGLRDKALKFGLAEEQEFEEMAQAWEEWTERNDASLAMLNAEILIEK